MVEGLMFTKTRFSWKGKNGLHANLGLLWTLVLVAYFVGFSIFFWYENVFISDKISSIIRQDNK